jgi:hypothetical protein
MYRIIAVALTVMVTVGVVLLAVYVSPYAISLITLPAIGAPLLLLDAFSE